MDANQGEVRWWWAHQKETRFWGSDVPRVGSPAGPAPARLPRSGLRPATVSASVLGTAVAVRHGRVVPPRAAGGLIVETAVVEQGRGADAAPRRAVGVRRRAVAKSDVIVLRGVVAAGTEQYRRLAEPDPGGAHGVPPSDSPLQRRQVAVPSAMRCRQPGHDADIRRAPLGQRAKESDGVAAPQ